MIRHSPRLLAVTLDNNPDSEFCCGKVTMPVRVTYFGAFRYWRQRSCRRSGFMVDEIGFAELIFLRSVPV